MKPIKTSIKNSLKQIADFMCIAAETAPKAKGIDNIITLIIDKEKDKHKIIDKMLKIAKDNNKPGFERDAHNIEKIPIIVIIGTKVSPIGLTYCSFCGYENCDSLAQSNAVCAFNPLDLGIAAGSAVNVANNFHVDNRIMYSIGKAAIELNYLKNKNVKLCLGIPLSVSGKNPFFDRT